MRELDSAMRALERQRGPGGEGLTGAKRWPIEEARSCTESGQMMKQRTRIYGAALWLAGGLTGSWACGGTGLSGGVRNPDFASFTCGYRELGTVDSTYEAELTQEGYRYETYGLSVKGGPIADSAQGFLTADWPLTNWEVTKEDDGRVHAERLEYKRFKRPVIYRADDSNNSTIACEIFSSELHFAHVRSNGRLSFSLIDVPPWEAKVDIEVLARNYIEGLGFARRSTAVQGIGNQQFAVENTVRVGYPVVEDFSLTNRGGDRAVHARVAVVDPERRRVVPQVIEERIELLLTRIIVGEPGQKRAALLVVRLDESPEDFQAAQPIFKKLATLTGFTCPGCGATVPEKSVPRPPHRERKHRGGPLGLQVPPAHQSLQGNR